MENYTDRFGTRYIVVDEQSYLNEELKDYINKVPITNAIIFKTKLDRRCIIDFLRDELNINEHITLQGKIDDRYIYLLRNGSNCPEVLNGKIRSAGINIIVKRNNIYYAIMVKDKTKSVITSIGGTCNLEEYEHPKKYRTKQCVNRELREETEGTIKLWFDSVKIPGYSIKTGTRNDFCRVCFNSSYFGINNIDDRYILQPHYIDLDNELVNSPFLGFLFSKNMDSYGNYTLTYIDHTETENIHAIKLQDLSLLDLDKNNNTKTAILTLVNKLNDPILDIYSNDIKVSKLHLLLSYIHLIKLNANMNPIHLDDLTGLNLHPSVRSITIN